MFPADHTFVSSMRAGGLSVFASNIFPSAEHSVRVSKNRGRRSKWSMVCIRMHSWSGPGSELEPR